jgi:hypothetical protein
MNAPTPAVGVLWSQGFTYGPVPVQPGGPGTQVVQPPENPQEGTFTSPCGPHSFNNWSVYWVAIDGVQFGLVCCPLCSWIQYILTPAEVYAQFNFIGGG